MTEQSLITALTETEAERVRWMTAALTAGNEIAELKAQVNCLREAALDAISFMVGGAAKAKLRDAYDATPEQCLVKVKAKAVEKAIKDCTITYRDGLGDIESALDEDALRKYPKKIRKKAKEQAK